MFAELTTRLHDLTAEEILKETGSRKEASMRHFTGMWARSDSLNWAHA